MASDSHRMPLQKLCCPAHTEDCMSASHFFCHQVCLRIAYCPVQIEDCMSASHLFCHRHCLATESTFHVQYLDCMLHMQYLNARSIFSIWTAWMFHILCCVSQRRVSWLTSVRSLPASDSQEDLEKSERRILPGSFTFFGILQHAIVEPKSKRLMSSSDLYSLSLKRTCLSEKVPVAQSRCLGNQELLTSQDSVRARTSQTLPDDLQHNSKINSRKISFAGRQNSWDAEKGCDSNCV